MLEPAGNLLRRPLALKLACHEARQGPVLRQFAGLGPKCPVPRSRLGVTRPVAAMLTVALDLTADSRYCSTERDSNEPDRVLCHHRTRDLLAFGQGQGQT